MSNHSNNQLISNDKLPTFFEDHFKDKKNELQTDVISPKNYSHILPPDDLTVNSNTP